MVESSGGRPGPPRLLVASGNPGKVREYRQLLSGLGLELGGIETEVPEDADTYAANAAHKAEAAASRSGLPAIGDDTGLEVEVLDGYPGLRSARVAPTQEERNDLLFSRLRDHPRPWRARFVCALALAVPGRPTRVFRGEVTGEVVEPRADGGFGYDPVFSVPEAGMTFAEMQPEVKNRWSHRGAAVRALLASSALRDLTARP